MHQDLQRVRGSRILGLLLEMRAFLKHINERLLVRDGKTNAGAEVLGKPGSANQARPLTSCSWLQERLAWREGR